jgi:hypothetical protein
MEKVKGVFPLALLQLKIPNPLPSDSTFQFYLATAKKPKLHLACESVSVSLLEESNKTTED